LSNQGIEPQLLAFAVRKMKLKRQIVGLEESLVEYLHHKKII